MPVRIVRVAAVDRPRADVEVVRECLICVALYDEFTLL